jgi:hypothetical protein
MTATPPTEHAQLDFDEVAELAPCVFAAITGAALSDGTRALTLGDGRMLMTLAAAAPADAGKLRPLIELAQQQLESLDGLMRERAVDFLARAPAAHGLKLTPTTAVELATLRERLRQALPSSMIEAGVARAVRLESVCTADDTAVWLSGWVHDAEPEHAELTFLSPEGVVVRPAVSFHARADVDETFVLLHPNPNRGFHAYAELEQPSLCASGWVLRMRSADGTEIEDVARAGVQRDPSAMLGRAMQVMRLPEPTDAMVEHQVLPALARVRAAEAVEVAATEDFGPVPSDPRFSVVLPVRALERIEHQLLSFADEPGVELLLVAGPDLAGTVRERGADWSELYGTDFRLVELTRAAPRARALNLGARVARAETLVLLDEDVFPQASGWLMALATALDEEDRPGVVGPRLLFPDGAIAAAGVEYRDTGTARERVFPWRGMSAALSGVQSLRIVRALPDACLMLRARDFRRCNGLSEDYPAGGEAAADLCLTLARDARGSRLADTSMYWLEGSPSQPQGPGAARLNAWLFSRRWDGALRGDRPGAGKPAAAELVDLLARDGSDGGPIAQWALTRPSNGESDGFRSANAVAVEGSIVTQDGQPATIELRSAGRTVGTTTANTRHDNGRDGPGAGAGFQLAVGTLGLPPRFELDVVAVVDGQEARLARITAQREPLTPARPAALQPVFVTTLGRSGSSWLTLLLACHPEILVGGPFRDDVRVASYWASVLRTLTSPASYIQTMRPEFYAGHWWVGDERASPLPMTVGEPRMLHWTAADNLNEIAGFCRGRVDAFYEQYGRLVEPHPRKYFAEKCWPDASVLEAAGELYPGAKELLLVRDFRDMVCSIIAFNAKRGFPSFGREVADSDEAMIGLLRGHALQLLCRLRHGGDQVLLVRYEDLVLDTEHTLTRIWDHLGVDGDWVTTREVIAAAAEMRPDVQRAHRTLDSVEATIGRWRSDLGPELKAACRAAFDDVLTAFGYMATE